MCYDLLTLLFLRFLKTLSLRLKYQRQKMLMSRVIKKLILGMRKTNAQTSCAVTASAYQRLCFRFIDSTNSLLSRSNLYVKGRLCSSDATRLIGLIITNALNCITCMCNSSRAPVYHFIWFKLYFNYFEYMIQIE